MLPDKEGAVKSIALRSCELIVNEISTKWGVYLSIFLACLSILLSLILTAIEYSLLYAIFLVIFVVILIPVDIGASSTIPLSYRSGYKTGEAKIDLEKIIDIYVSNRDMIEFLKETNEAIKALLLKEIAGKSEVIGKYKVTIVEFTRRTLNIEKARKKLEELGLLDEYLEKKIVYPKVKRL